MHHADGRFVLRYDAPSEVGALVETALAEAKDWLFRQGADHGGDAEAREAAEADRVTCADALALIASRSIDSVQVTSRRSKYRVNVFLDTDGGWLSGRPRLPQHLVDGLTCDGELIPVWTTEGMPVNLGRARRIVPDRTRRLIVDRDRGCRFPGCTAASFVEIHHLVHWRDGGRTDADNLVSLCPFHHDGHHRQEFSISGDPGRDDGLEFVTSMGLLIRPGPSTSLGSAAAPPGCRLSLVPDPPDPPDSGDLDRSWPADEGLPVRPPRPVPRLGRTYPSPTGDTLHPGLVDFTPYTTSAIST
jgi:hypothetical protein